METGDEQTFNVKLSEFLSAADDDRKTNDFAAYFRKEYAARPQLWAYCHRKGLRLHHNMHLEAMHRVLKHVHLKGRKVRRLDKSIHSLMCFVRTKMSDRLLKLHRGKWTRHVGGIRMRHKKSSQITVDMCDCIEQNAVYTVVTKDTAYTVRQSASVPHESATCPLECSDCKICVHAFSCTCLDSALRNTICKHVHAVVRLYAPVQTGNTTFSVSAMQNDETPAVTAMDDAEAADSDCSVPDVGAEMVPVMTANSVPQLSETDAILHHLVGVSDNNERSVVKADMLLASIRCAINTDKHLAPVAVEHLSKLVSLLTALQSKGSERLPALPATSEPVNKKITPQRVFRRTRKSKAKTRSVTISKPTSGEKRFLLESLSGNTPVLSHQPPTDHDYSNDVLSHTVNFEHAYART